MIIMIVHDDNRDYFDRGDDDDNHKFECRPFRAPGESWEKNSQIDHCHDFGTTPIFFFPREKNSLLG